MGLGGAGGSQNLSMEICDGPNGLRALVTFVMFQWYKLLYHKANPAIYEMLLELMFHIVVHVFYQGWRLVHTTNRQQRFIRCHTSFARVTFNPYNLNISDEKKNAPPRTVQLSGRSQG